MKSSFVAFDIFGPWFQLTTGWVRNMKCLALPIHYIKKFLNQGVTMPKSAMLFLKSDRVTIKSIKSVSILAPEAELHSFQNLLCAKAYRTIFQIAKVSFLYCLKTKYLISKDS